LIFHPKSNTILVTAFAGGKVHDFELFKRSKVEFSESACCLADSGYQGIQKLHPNSQTPRKKSKHHPLTSEEKAQNRALARQRIGVEHVFRRLKVFRLLSERYRNRRKRFGLRFNLIAALYNLEYAQ
jgi:transposase